MSCVLRTLVWCLACLLTAATASSAVAQSWPSKPVRIVIPYSPGGIADLAARIVGAKLTEIWGHQLIVDNRPGGNATIGMSAVAKAAPDGYTLLVATSGDFVLMPHLLKQIPYDVVRDFAPITSLTDSPTFLGANDQTPYKSMADLIADAKGKPGQLGVATAGVGGIQQVQFEWVASVAGIRLQHIPFKGGAPAAAAVAGGTTPLGLLSVASAVGHIKSGKIRVLAQMGAKRSEFIADVPTMQEAGLAGIDGSNWTLLAAPRATPQEIIDRINADTVKVLAMPDVIERLKAGASVTIPVTPAALARQIAAESAIIKGIVERTGITAE
jgi:tripartite-type tricarboxylate transporter receptor subunit TctC